MSEMEKSNARFSGDAPVAFAKQVLGDRRELALVALERTKTAMVVTDARQSDHPIILANRAFLDLTGYGADEIIGRNCRFMQGTETEVSDIAAIRAGLSGGEEFQIELLNYRKDGTRFWNRLMISPVYDEAGQLLYHFASQHDVSARRRAEASERAERLLLMEIDHRTMNALALVQSFVRLGTNASVQAYASGIQSRVDALARAHRLLAQNGWSDISLGDLINSEIPRRSANNVTASGPALQLAAKIVQPIALTVHELMSNSLMHGALSHLDGHVDITWECEDLRTALRWKERGAPWSGPVIEAFGLGLVRGVIERQLRGTVELNWSADGLAAQLTFDHLGLQRPSNLGLNQFRQG